LCDEYKQARKELQINNDCSPPFIVCNDDGTCEHKDLFPMTRWEIGALFIFLGILMISVIVSIAGGIIIVPIAVFLLGFTANQAVALSNSVVVMTSLIKYLMSLFRSNPVVSWRTIIDYNGALLLIPTMALFSTIGSIISSFLPDVLILFMLVTTMFLSIYTGVANLRRQMKVETEHRKVSSHIPANAVGPYQPATNKLEIIKPSPETVITLEDLPQKIDLNIEVLDSERPLNQDDL